MRYLVKVDLADHKEKHVKLKIKKLHPDAVIPKYQTAGASAFDLHSVEDMIFFSGETKVIKTGLSIELPPDTELQIRPRSGVSLKTTLRIANSPGTVDEDFRGEIGIIMTNLNHNIAVHVNKGDRIAQGAVCPVLRPEIEEVEELSDTERGEKGFGSTGV